MESQSIVVADHKYAGIQAVTFGLDDIYDEDNLGRYLWAVINDALYQYA